MTDETRSGVRQASAEEVMWTLSEAVAEIERLRAEVQKTADRPTWIRNYVECAAERDRLRAAQAWQPIATAPRGKWLLLAVAGAGVSTIGMIRRDGSAGLYHEKGPQMGEYCPTHWREQDPPA